MCSVGLQVSILTPCLSRGLFGTILYLRILIQLQVAVVYRAVPVIPLFLTIGMCRPSSSRKRLARPKSTMKILSCCPLGPKTKLLGLISLDVKWQNQELGSARLWLKVVRVPVLEHLFLEFCFQPSILEHLEASAIYAQWNPLAYLGTPK